MAMGLALMLKMPGLALMLMLGAMRMVQVMLQVQGLPLRLGLQVSK